MKPSRYYINSLMEIMFVALLKKVASKNDVENIAILLLSRIFG